MEVKQEFDEIVSVRDGSGRKFCETKWPCYQKTSQFYYELLLSYT